MSEWISVYSRHPVSLNAEAMHRELDAADLATEAELLGLDEDEADAAAESAYRHLRVDRIDSAPEASAGEAVEVRWNPAGRPIQLRSLTGPEARQQATETLQELLPSATGPGPGPGPERIRSHLRRARQIVNLEMSAQDAQHLGAAIGGLLAFSLAEAGDGLVWFFDRDWVAPDDRGATLWTPP